MRIGDNDGYNKVYTPLGILIFETNEKLIKRVPDKEFWLYYYRKPRRIIGTCEIIFWGVYGKGAFFITDRRIVFIRRPLPEGEMFKVMNRYDKSGDQGGRGPVGDGIRHSRKVNDYGGFDYAEIRYEDIAFVRKGLLFPQMFLLVNGKHYDSSIDRDVFQLILPILGERNIRIEWGRFKRGRKVAIPKSKS
jgi:hypothetical protein